MFSMYSRIGRTRVMYRVWQRCWGGGLNENSCGTERLTRKGNIQTNNTTAKSWWSDLNSCEQPQHSLANIFNQKVMRKMRYKRKFVDESSYIVSLPEDTRHFYNVVTGKSLQSSHFNNNIMQIEVQILILDSAFHLALVYDHYALYHVT